MIICKHKQELQMIFSDFSFKVTKSAPATKSQQWTPPKWKKASAEPEATRAKSMAADPENNMAWQIRFTTKTTNLWSEAIM